MSSEQYDPTLALSQAKKKGITFFNVSDCLELVSMFKTATWTPVTEDWIGVGKAEVTHPEKDREVLGVGDRVSLEVWEISAPPCGGEEESLSALV